MNSRNNSTRAVMTRKTIDSVQLIPLSGSMPIASKRSCQRSSTHETATYRKSSTQLLLGRRPSGPTLCQQRGLRGDNGQGHGVVPTRVEGMTTKQPAHREPTATRGAVQLNRLLGVGAARGVEAA